MKLPGWHAFSTVLLVVVLLDGCAANRGTRPVWLPLPGAWAELAAASRAAGGGPMRLEDNTTRSLERHSITQMGFTITHQKFTMDAQELQEVLAEVQDSGVNFRTDFDTDRSFGRESNKTWRDVDGLEVLPWWKPWEVSEPAYYSWSMHEPNTPRTFVWLQVSDWRRGRKLVYMRVES